jgi:hypothetical protein
MAQKKLQTNSVYNEYDLDGDGIVTDEEMELMREMHEVERADRKQMHQRYMAWYSLIGMISYPATIIGCELLIPNSNASKLLTDIAPTYFIAAAGIAGAFMGFSAMGSKPKPPVK